MTTGDNPAMTARTTASTNWASGASTDTGGSGAAGGPVSEQDLSGIRAFVPDVPSLSVGDRDDTARPFVDAVTDYLYPMAPISDVARPDVQVIAHDALGYGDLFFAIKAARILKRNLRIDNISVVWVSPVKHVTHGDKEKSAGEEDAQREFEAVLPASPGFPIIRRTSFDPGDLSLGNKILVVGPTQNCGNFKLPNVVYLTEYEAGGRTDINANSVTRGARFIRSGVSPGTSGIMFDQEPVPDLSVVQARLGDAPVVAGQYYFMYVNAAHELCLQILESIHKGALPKDIIIAGGRGQLGKIRAAVARFAKGNTRIDLVNFNANAKRETLNPTGKALTTVRFGTLRNTEFRAALTHSARLRFVTGDQSLTEALALSDSLILYEKTGHKHPLVNRLVSMRTLPLFVLQSGTTAADAAKWYGSLKPPAGSDPLANLRMAHSLERRLTCAVHGIMHRCGNPAVRTLTDDITSLATNNRLTEIPAKLRELQALIR